MGVKSTRGLALVTAIVAVTLIKGIVGQCVDVDQKAFNVTGTNLTETTREKMSDLGLYCDITISWNASNSTLFDESKHKAAYALYLKLYAQATPDSIDGERKAGITKDCLAFSYKVFCAYNIPKCSDGKDVTITDLEPRCMFCHLRYL